MNIGNVQNVLSCERMTKTIEITEEERYAVFHQDFPCPVSPHERCYAYQGLTRCDDCPLIRVEDKQ